jgi:hypothetical protein
MSTTITGHEKRNTHERWATVKNGDLKDWVVVARGTLADFARGVVGKYEIDADEHCTNDCPGCH